MASGFFREKSIDKVSSPEQLDEYIRAATPGMWLVLAALLLLLAGACVWAVFGHMETAVQIVAVSRGGTLECYIPEAQADALSAGMEVRVNGASYPVSEMSETPRQIPEGTDAYALHLGGLSVGAWVFTASAETDLPDGVYQAVIITERVSPLSFLIN